MLIFPAIDLLDGSAVRLSQGKRDSAKIYSKEPWEIAKGWSKLGIPRLHVVDLDAAFARAAGTPKPGAHNRAVIRKIVETTGLEVEVGGGVRTLEDCEALFDVGVKHVVLGTAAVKDPAMVREACARWPKKIVVAVDAREGKVSVEGWTEDTSASALDVGLAVARAGAGAVLYTDIGRDGMRTGPNLDATARLVRHLDPCPVIASGGVARIGDLDALLDTGAFAVVIGKALYEGVFTVEDALKRVRERAI
ncbi:MAG TPA: 1-(5-phosphoribosyl)-5-[(5-phosphoribosylamino)methylideneamino]imidazole-4-carboxamide isomerase [Polyangia bacterium]|nr:1-(5-phosphoribosyl)-5-[(5-phosphoribosylamino)methylideneamino]imidazole-4-carboxamide isomerase [Polyangia bacterium]